MRERARESQSEPERERECQRAREKVRNWEMVGGGESGAKKREKVIV